MKKVIEKPEEPTRIIPKKRSDKWTIEVVIYRHGDREELFL